jgi:hypothetical protein
MEWLEEWLECPSKLEKRLGRLKLPSKIIKHWANIGLRKMESLSVQQELALPVRSARLA